MNDYGDQSRAGFDDRGPWFDAARRRVRAPGVLLQLIGALAVALGTAFGVIGVANPEGFVNWYIDGIEDLQKQQPPEKREKLPQRDEAVKSMKVEGPLYGALTAVIGVLIFVGGSKMKDLRGYGWAMAGSILSIFPGMCCCCIGLLPGVWALVVLLNSDVKLAFTRNAQPADRDVPPDSRME